MMVTKKCSVCGYQFTFDNELRTNLYISPKNKGAKGYFDLWHFFVEKCPKCGYASVDITETENKDIVKSKRYSAPGKDILEDLAEARPNKIEDYLLAEIYYESINDHVMRAKCLFQAADLVYAELMYWAEYIFDTADGGRLQDDMQYVKFESFAEELYAKGLKILKEYIDKNPDDIDAAILYAGICSDGSSMQKMQGVKELKKLMLNPRLNSLQKEIVAYLLQDI